MSGRKTQGIVPGGARAPSPGGPQSGWRVGVNVVGLQSVVRILSLAPGVFTPILTSAVTQRELGGSPPCSLTQGSSLSISVSPGSAPGTQNSPANTVCSSSSVSQMDEGLFQFVIIEPEFPLFKIVFLTVSPAFLGSKIK